MPYFIGTDPDWYETQRRRRENQMADLLSIMQWKEETRRKRGADALALFEANPDFVETTQWEDWVEKYGNQFPIEATLLPSLAAKRRATLEDTGRTVASMIQNSMPTNSDINDVAPRMRGEEPDLFAATGIEPGTGPLRPEFWPEAGEPAGGEKSRFQVPSNPMWAGQIDPQIMEDPARLMGVLTGLKGSLGMEFDKMLQPTDTSGFSQATRNLILGGLMPEAEQSSLVQGGLAMSPEQEASRAEAERTHRATEGEMSRYHDLTIEQQRLNREQRRAAAASRGPRGGKGAQAAAQSVETVMAELTSTPDLIEQEKDERGKALPAEKRSGMPKDAARAVAGAMVDIDKARTKQQLPEKFLSPSYFRPESVKSIYELALASRKGNRAQAAQDVKEFYRSWRDYAYGTGDLDRALSITSRFLTGE